MPFLEEPKGLTEAQKRDREAVKAMFTDADPEQATPMLRAYDTYWLMSNAQEAAAKPAPVAAAAPTATASPLDKKAAETAAGNAERQAREQIARTPRKALLSGFGSADAQFDEEQRKKKSSLLSTVAI